MNEMMRMHDYDRKPKGQMNEAMNYRCIIFSSNENQNFPSQMILKGEGQIGV